MTHAYVLASALTGVSLALALFIMYRYSYSSSSSDSGSESESRSASASTDASLSSDDERKKKGPGIHHTRANDTKIRDAQSHPQRGADIVTSEGFTTIQLTVPRDMVGPIIGRKGFNIKQIQAETKTKIDFEKQTSEGPERTITIRGSEKGAQDAELRILHIVYGQPGRNTHTMQVPHGSLGFIIGKGGENIKKIQENSECRVKVGASNNEGGDLETLADVDLTGTDEQILSATGMIKEFVESWQSKRGRMTSHVRQPHVRKPVTAPALPGSPLHCERWPDHSDYVECYVTATVDPSHLWVQLISSRSTSLEQINAQLCDLYCDPFQFIDDLVTQRPPIGTTVAALHPAERKWYRGKIMAYGEGEEQVVDVYYLDYGDSDWMPLESTTIQLLRPEFYHLPAQALECYTNLVLNPESPSNWTEELCTAFEALAHTGDWKVLMGAAVSYKSVDGELGQYPVISLVDTTTDLDVNITEEIAKILRANRMPDEATSSTQHGTEVGWSDLDLANGVIDSVPVATSSSTDSCVASATNEPNPAVLDSSQSLGTSLVVDDSWYTGPSSSSLNTENSTLADASTDAGVTISSNEPDTQSTTEFKTS